MRIGIVGATGIVGQELLSILPDSKLKVSELRLSASSRSVGTVIETYLGEKVIESIDANFFQHLDLCFFCVSSEISRKWIPIAADQGVICIDNSSAFRMNPDVPIVVPEVNGDLLKSKPAIIANPNCCVAQLVVALAPIHDKFGIREVTISTYQSVSGAGNEALQKMKAEALQPNEQFWLNQFMYNVIPNIGPCDQGHYQEEVKIIEETRKILKFADLPISVTAARVPVIRGHCQAVSFTTKKETSAEAIEALLNNAPNIDVINDIDQHNHPQPVTVQYTNQVYVGRIRQNTWHKANSFSIWVVADNLRKGAAHNALSIAEWCELS